jgi:hypothetical protein
MKLSSGFGNLHVSATIKSSSTTRNVWLFGLLLLVATKDSISTRNILRRKGMALQDYNCMLCSQSSEETVEHLFLDCTFAKECWNLINLEYPQGHKGRSMFQALEISENSSKFLFFHGHFRHSCAGAFGLTGTISFQWIHAILSSCKSLLITKLPLLLHTTKASSHPL